MTTTKPYDPLKIIANVACHECDLLVELVGLEEGQKASCPRCGFTLTAQHNNARQRVIAFSLSSLIFLFFSFLFPFLTFSAQGQERGVTLMQSITVMVDEGFSSLALVIFVSTIAIPTSYLLSALYAYISLSRPLPLIGTQTSLKLMGFLKHWSMAEIFLIGILVSFIKIASLAEVSLGLSFWSFVLFILTMSAAILHIDQHQAWNWLKQKHTQSPPSIGRGDAHLSCHVCLSVNSEVEDNCGICGSELHKRNKNSIQVTWALLITSVVLYLPANLLPIMRTNFLGEETANTILGGVVVLWQHGSYPIALVIFIASVLVPVGKIIALGLLCHTAQSKQKKSKRQKMKLYRATELVGRWSMVDVFVVAILVALIKLGNIMSIYPGWGALAFAFMVIVTVLAAISFDPRLIWDETETERIIEQSK
jgi:paraquat-inducible protein A